MKYSLMLNMSKKVLQFQFQPNNISWESIFREIVDEEMLIRTISELLPFQCFVRSFLIPKLL